MPPLGMYRRQTATRLPQYNPGHPGYQPGPIASTLPQRAGMPSVAPVQLGGVPSRPFGMTMPQSTAGGMMTNGRPNVYPGSGMAYTYGFGGGGPLSAADQTQVNRIRDYEHAGLGPYGGTAGMAHFGPLRGQQQRPLMIPEDGTRYAGGSTAATVDGRSVLTHQNYVPTTEMNRAGALRGQGRTVAYVQTGAPAGGLSSDMEQRRLAAVDRQADRKQMLAAGRNIRANSMYGSPLRPDLFPRAEAAYAGAGPNSRQQGVNALVSRNTVSNDDGSTTTDFGGVATGLYDQFRDDPARAWSEFVKAGGTTADLQDAIDAARPGAFFGGNPSLHEWLLKMQQAGAGRGNSIARGQSVLGAGRARGLGLGTSSLLTSQLQSGEPLPGYPSY